MMKLRFSPGAAAFVLQETEILRKRDHFAALRLKGSLAQLREMRRDSAGKQRNPELDNFKGVYRGIIGDYVYFYQVADGYADILAMRHSRREDLLSIAAPPADAEKSGLS